MRTLSKPFLRAPAVLAPDFERMPAEMTELRSWVAWKGAKVPYCATALNSKASATDPDTWSSFDQAQTAYEEGDFLGVGFMLGGGIVGVDIDHCAVAGEPRKDALELLEHIGCGYIEISPSGTGLHGLGYGPQIKGTRGKFEGISVELYSQERYLTMTGRPIKDGPLVPLLEFEAIAEQVRAQRASLQSSDPQRQQRSTESTDVIFSAVSVVSVVSVGLLADPATIPLHEGDRNRRLFELARRMRAVMPNSTEKERRTVVQEWHRMHIEAFRTKELSVSLDDFERSWKSVRVLPGETMSRLLEGADLRAPLPAALAHLGYGHSEIALWHVCAALQASAGAEPFFIASRTAAEILGHSDHKISAAMLRTFVRDGVLHLVSKGAGRVASRYRLAWDGAGADA